MNARNVGLINRVSLFLFLFSFLVLPGYAFASDVKGTMTLFNVVDGVVSKGYEYFSSTDEFEIDGQIVNPDENGMVVINGATFYIKTVEPIVTTNGYLLIKDIMLDPVGLAKNVTKNFLAVGLDSYATFLEVCQNNAPISGCGPTQNKYIWSNTPITWEKTGMINNQQVTLKFDFYVGWHNAWPESTDWYVLVVDKNDENTMSALGVNYFFIFASFAPLR